MSAAPTRPGGRSPRLPDERRGWLSRRRRAVANRKRPLPPRERFADMRKRVRRAAWHGGVYLLVAAAAAAVPLLGLLGYRAVVASPYFHVGVVHIGGNQRVARAEILIAAGLDREQSTLGLDTEAMARAVARHPWIRTARVRTELPDTVDIQVTEHVPAALLALSELYLVNVQGEILRRVEPTDDVAVPALTGFERDDFSDPAGVRDATQRIKDALAVARAYRDEGLGPLSPLAEVRSDAVFGHILTTARGEEIWLGRQDYRPKLRKWRLIQEDLRRRGQRAAVAYLHNDEAPQRVTVRPVRVGPAPTPVAGVAAQP